MVVSEMVKCENCKSCVFDNGHGNPSRYYCSHKDNPERARARGVYTLICITNTKEFTVKSTPGWCPKEK